MLRLALLSALCLLCACRPNKDAEASEPLTNAASTREATRVRTAPLETREMVRLLSTTTTIESDREVEVLPRIGGVIVQVLVEEGDRVEKDQVLAIIDQREAEARLKDARLGLKEAQDQVPRLKLATEEALERSKSAELGYEQAKSEYERNEGAGLISQVDLGRLKLTQDTNERTWKASQLTHLGAAQDEAQQQDVIDRAKLTIAREELSLSFTEITAPFAGVVASRVARVGATVSTGAPAFVLTDPEHLRCIVPRPQRELGFFEANRAEGGEVEIRVVPESYPDDEYVGTIEIVAPTIDTQSGSFRLTIHLEQPPAGDPRPRLMPGMLVRLSIVTERHPDALVVPKRALRREGDRHFLYIDEGGKAGRAEVVEGFSDDEFVEVLPLDPNLVQVGTLVVVVGNRDLEDGEDIEAEAWSRSGERGDTDTADASTGDGE